MVLGLYYSIFIISLVLVVIYAFIFHKHFDVNLTIMTALCPIINLSFVIITSSTVIEEALVGLKISYICGCFLMASAMFLVFHVCEINLKPWLRAIIITLSCCIFVSALSIGHLDIFYKDIPTLVTENGASYIVNRNYGFMHTIFYIMVGLYYASTVGVLIYSFFRKKQVSRTILLLIVLSVTIAFVGFFLGRLITNKIELLPFTTTLGIILYLIIASRLRLYDASDSVTDSIVEKGDTGFISFDNKMRYLNSNETAKRMIPELNHLKVDHRDEWVDENFLPWVKVFEENEENNKQFITRDGRSYLISINRLVIGHLFHSHKGYQFFVSDDTANQQYIALIKNYNSQLEEEVAKKTKSVVEMHEKLVLGMATMVESRDNSTGGHIKRTSDCIRLLVEEIKKDNTLNLSDEFCHDLIKAAPMHDLGKIVVDDAILRKPGRFTPEEYEIMKTHASEGARIVAAILEGTEDKQFMKIAVNVAHYHHERWDGSGYPEGLKGEEIPLEARIMAIADVYDALVSKRVYKDSMSFEAANSIIMEGMGKHFDKSLEPYYLRARPLLEEYYSKSAK